ncbi:energy-coupling factor transporter ATPase, partial [Virgibacillus sp. 7505]
MENRGWPPEQISRRVAAVAKELGIETLLKRDVSRLSGGQKQRVALGGVLAPDPDILVLDEATSMLDPAGQREWLSLL